MIAEKSRWEQLFELLFFLLIGVAAVTACILVTGNTVKRYEKISFYEAVITEIFYLDDGGMLTYEYSENLKQNVMVSYQKAGSEITGKLEYHDAGYQVGQNITVYEEKGKIMAEQGLWADTILFGYISLLFLIISVQYFIRLFWRKKSKRALRYHPTVNSTPSPENASSAII